MCVEGRVEAELLAFAKRLMENFVEQGVARRVELKKRIQGFAAVCISQVRGSALGDSPPDRVARSARSKDTPDPSKDQKRVNRLLLCPSTSLIALSERDELALAEAGHGFGRRDR